mmetsp:Transcript_6090/g.18856  ORF Transcript_6090/g.18856 Transcript_6090/m.18856 type:complete len:97 (-) Transcript_6090:531-821(-)
MMTKMMVGSMRMMGPTSPWVTCQLCSRPATRMSAQIHPYLVDLCQRTAHGGPHPYHQRCMVQLLEEVAVGAVQCGRPRRLRQLLSLTPLAAHARGL